MKVRFWGTRGSVAVPGRDTVRYGGNTSCVEVLTSGGTLFILDCGTGARELGQSLLSRISNAPIVAHILLTHTHWDHIQGFPFFTPAFMPGNEFTIYSSRGSDKKLEDVLAGQMEYTYFPVALRQMGSRIRVQEVDVGRFTIGDAEVETYFLNHTAATLGYRITSHDAVLVYAPDHEPYTGFLRHGEVGIPSAPVHPELQNPEEVTAAEQRFRQWCRDADLLIHDAQFTQEEYADRLGWGHSTPEYAVDVALDAKAKRLALFHHDPSHPDDAVEQIAEAGKRRVAERGGTLEVFAAAERSELILEETPSVSAQPGG